LDQTKLTGKTDYVEGERTLDDNNCTKKIKNENKLKKIWFGKKRDRELALAVRG